MADDNHSHERPCPVAELRRAMPWRVPALVRLPFFSHIFPLLSSLPSLSPPSDGVDLSHSSLVHGRGATPISFPYHHISQDTQEHWRILEEMKHVPFHHWNGRAIVAWITTGLGEGGGRERESGEEVLSTPPLCMTSALPPQVWASTLQ